MIGLLRLAMPPACQIQHTTMTPLSTRKSLNFWPIADVALVDGSSRKLMRNTQCLRRRGRAEPRCGDHGGCGESPHKKSTTTEGHDVLLAHRHCRVGRQFLVGPSDSISQRLDIEG